jgi:hypothetical protein
MFAPRLTNAGGGVGSTTAPAVFEGRITVAVPGDETSFL